MQLIKVTPQQLEDAARKLREALADGELTENHKIWFNSPSEISNLIPDLDSMRAEVFDQL